MPLGSSYSTMRLLSRSPTTIGRPSSLASFASLLSFLLLLSQHLQPCSGSFVLTVPPLEEECFIIRAHSQRASILTGNFDVLDDTLPADPVSVVIMDTSNDRMRYRSPRLATEGTFKVNLDAKQRMAICVQNGIRRLRTPSRGTVKDQKHIDDLDRNVGLEFLVEPRNEHVELKNANSKLMDAATGLRQKLRDLRSHHVYMKSREGKHRRIAEKTFSQLLVWCLMEAVIIILIAVGQIMYFRRFLEKRRYM